MTKYDLRKYLFSERIVDLWNSLLACIFKSSSVNSFKRNSWTRFGEINMFIITIKQPQPEEETSIVM